MREFLLSDSIWSDVFWWTVGLNVVISWFTVSVQAVTWIFRHLP